MEAEVDMMGDEMKNIRINGQMMVKDRNHKVILKNFKTRIIAEEVEVVVEGVEVVIVVAEEVEGITRCN